MDTRFAAGAEPAVSASAVSTAIARERRYAARNYDPLPVVLAHGDGCWLWDEHGRRYLDMMSAYSAVSHGHAHPRIVRALVEQAQRLAVTSRVFHNELLPAFLQRLAEVTGLDRALPANGGAEAVETALKAARKWGHKIKGIPADRAGDHRLRRQFPRPLDHDRRLFVRAAVSRRLRAVRAGIPPGSVRRRRRAGARDRPQHRRVSRRADPGRRRDRRSAGRLSRAVRAHLPRAATCCSICDEIQTGMGRTGKFLACEHENVQARRRHSRQGAGRRTACPCRRWSAPTT